MSHRTLPSAALRALVLAGLVAALPAAADSPTLHWSVPMPAGQAWRIVDLREGNGIRHEEWIPRGQGVEDYRDRIIVQRMNAQDMNPETYLAHISAGLRAHCADFTTSGLVPAERDGMPAATLTAYCARFRNRSYGYVIAHKALRDGDHLFVVEREWRVPAYTVDATGLANLNFGDAADDVALKREIRSAVRWLIEAVQPGAPVAAEAPPPPPRARRRP